MKYYRFSYFWDNYVIVIPRRIMSIVRMDAFWHGIEDEET